MDLKIILYILLIVLLLLFYAVLYLAYKTSKQNKIINKPQEDYGDSLVIIESAQKQANAIVEKAVESAKHILFETEYVKQDITKEMQDSLQKVAEETIKMVQGRSSESEKEFRAVVDEIKQEFAKEATSKLSAIEQVTKEETDDFKEILRRETISSQEFIGKKIGEDFVEVQKEIDTYKKIRLSEIDKTIEAITKQVVKETLGASLTLPIQEDLVLASLENAKKTGLFKTLEEQSIVPPTPPASEFTMPSEKSVLTEEKNNG